MVLLLLDSQLPNRKSSSPINLNAFNDKTESSSARPAGAGQWSGVN